MSRKQNYLDRVNFIVAQFLIRTNLKNKKKNKTEKKKNWLDLHKKKWYWKFSKIKEKTS